MEVPVSLRILKGFIYFSLKNTVRVSFIATLLIVNACIKMDSNEQSSRAVNNSQKNQKEKNTVSTILNDYKKRGGVLDLQTKSNLKLLGNYEHSKLIGTQIILKGDGETILRSTNANALKRGGSFPLGANYQFIELTEYFNGNSVTIQFNAKEEINYRLQL